MLSKGWFGIGRQSVGDSIPPSIQEAGWPLYQDWEETFAPEVGSPG
jgi:hypothetical protein